MTGDGNAGGKSNIFRAEAILEDQSRPDRVIEYMRMTGCGGIDWRRCRKSPGVKSDSSGNRFHARRLRSIEPQRANTNLRRA